MSPLPVPAGVTLIRFHVWELTGRRDGTERRLCRRCGEVRVVRETAELPTFGCDGRRSE